MSEAPVVETRLGKVKGILLPKAKCESAKQVFYYGGIPYAKPPIGDLRFEPPEEPEPWEGDLEGCNNKSNPQQDTSFFKIMSKYFPEDDMLGYDPYSLTEDCLYLNVFTSNPIKRANMPVIVFLYGGGLQTGFAGPYHGGVISGLHDVIIVVPNYRVNIFGFLSNGDPNTGNMALWDQNMALKWVQNHISDFGGNPNNVTLFGQSAGASCVGFQVQSPMSRGLFHRAIASSGNIYMTKIPFSDQVAAFDSFKKHLKLEGDYCDVMDKIKQISTEKIKEAQTEIAKEGLYFSPIVDGKFLLNEPSESSDQGEGADIPFLMGVTDSECGGLVTLEYPPKFKEGLSRDEVLHIAEGDLRSQAVLKGISQQSFDDVISKYAVEHPEDDPMRWSRVYADLMGDKMFVISTMKQALAHSRQGKTTYLYEMSHRFRYSYDREYGPTIEDKASCCDCDHGDDLMFSWGSPLSGNVNVKFTDDEVLLSRQWMTYITNFASTGDPNKGNPVEVEWPLFETNGERYLSFKRPITQEKELHKERLNIFEDVLFNKKQ